MDDDQTSLTPRTELPRSLPAGASAGHGTRGWKLSKKGNSWTYTDTTGTPLSGITHLVIVDKSHISSNNVVPGRVQVTVSILSTIPPFRTEFLTSIPPLSG